MSDEASSSFVDSILKEIKDQYDAGTLNPRWSQMGFDDIDKQQFSAAEVFGAYRYELKTGRTLRRPRPDVPGEKGDFIDVNTGVQWDVKGPLGLKRDFEGFLTSLKKHMRSHPKGDERMIVDVAGFSSEEVARVEAVVSSYPSTYYTIQY